MHTTLTSKGRITLPLVIRTQLGLEAGDQPIATVGDAKTIVLKRRVGRPVSVLRGLLPKPAKALTVQEMHAGVSRHLVRKEAGK
jgi:antitoxin PrlF